MLLKWLNSSSSNCNVKNLAFFFFSRSVDDVKSQYKQLKVYVSGDPKEARDSRVICENVRRI